MAKLKPTLLSIIITISIIVIGGIFYISVHGENNQAIMGAERFFEDIKNSNYSKLQLPQQNSQKNNNSGIENSIKYYFALEFSLLEHFNLLEKEDYKVKIKRDNLWVPFLNEKDLRLNVILLEKKKSPSFTDLFKKSDIKPLNSLLIYTRNSGRWVLKKVNFENTPIHNSFTKLLSEADLNKYISTSESGFNINNIKVNTSELSEFEKRVLILNLKKALELLKKS